MTSDSSFDKMPGMMKARHFLLAVLIPLFAYGVWQIMRKPPEPVIPPVPVAVQEETPEPPPPVQVRKSPKPAPPPVAESEETPAPVPDRIPLEEAEARFAQAINLAAACLGLELNSTAERLSPTSADWIAEMRRELGEPMLDTEDWSVTTLVTPDGERRLIRFEIDYTDPENVVRKLTYYRDLGNGTAAVIPLSDEQATEPSETFRASLEADGEVVERERSHRVYFDTGEEIVVTEKNGFVEELDMNRQGRSFSCRPFDPSPLSCQCR